MLLSFVNTLLCTHYVLAANLKLEIYTINVFFMSWAVSKGV